MCVVLRWRVCVCSGEMEGVCVRGGSRISEKGGLLMNNN